MSAIPKMAFAVRQPWAWAIIHAGKPVENRDWQSSNPGLRFRGRVAVLASRGMTKDEYIEGYDFMRGIGVICPPPGALLRGGIIGSVDMVDVVTEHPSAWFFGPYAFVLRDPTPCEFVAAGGALGFFEWTPDSGRPVAPAKWMLPQ